jgi:Fe-S cluster assembly iron-binding protein IscA
MSFSIPYQSTKEIGAGEFHCPCCKTQTAYSHCRVLKKRINLIFFIPFGGVEEILGEYVKCTACNAHLEASILLDAGVVSETLAADSSLKNVVSLSDAAAVEIERRMTNGGYEPGTYIRVIPDATGSACDVKFDLPYADDGEWLGRDRGFSIVIDRELADLVLGMEIDFDGDTFYSRLKR